MLKLIMERRHLVMDVKIIFPPILCISRHISSCSSQTVRMYLWSVVSLKSLLGGECMFYESNESMSHKS